MADEEEEERRSGRSVAFFIIGILLVGILLAEPVLPEN
jgi:hypothetical protein